MLALAVVARAEEEQFMVDLEEEEAFVDVAQELRNLLHFSDEDDQEHDKELGINREARANNEEASEVESKAVVEPEDQARYNKFMDTFYRRVNADARSTIDPMEVPITAGKDKKAIKNGAKKGAAKKDGAEKDGVKKGAGNKNGPKKDGAGKKKVKKNEKKGKNKKSENKKSKKTGRHPKSLGVEVEDETADEEFVDDEEDHTIVTREAEEVEEIEEDEDEIVLVRQERSTDLVEEDKDNVNTESAVARRVSGGKAGPKKKKGGNNKNKNKKNNNKKNKSKAKRSANKNNKKKGKSNKKKKSSKSATQTSRASVSGIATLKRIGDVQVVNRKDGKELRSEFSIGPVSLKINRKFGSGQNAVMRSATANAPELTGKMNLYVAANGKAKITKFTISKPSVVTTDGSLSKDQNKRGGNNNFMEMSIARSTPFAAKKLKLAARDVLLATESKN